MYGTNKKVSFFFFFVFLIGLSTHPSCLDLKAKCGVSIFLSFPCTFASSRKSTNPFFTASAFWVYIFLTIEWRIIRSSKRVAVSKTHKYFNHAYCSLRDDVIPRLFFVFPTGQLLILGDIAGW